MSDELSNAVGKFVRKVLRWVPFVRMFPARVVSQAANAGPVDVLPDDAEIKGTGFQGIQLRHGLPGWKVKVPAGARVRLCFDAADAARPFAALWDEGSVTELAFDGGTKAVARVDDTVNAGRLFAVTQTVSGVPVVVAVYYFDPTSEAWTIVANGVAPPTLPSDGTPLRGKITSGNTKLLA